MLLCLADGVTNCNVVQVSCIHVKILKNRHNGTSLSNLDCIYRKHDQDNFIAGGFLIVY